MASPDHTTAQHGLLLFAYVIRTGNVHGLSDLELTRALAGSQLVTTARDLSPTLADTYTRVRHTILGVQRARAIASTPPVDGPCFDPVVVLGTQGTGGTSPTPDSDRPNEGPMAKLRPSPVTRPPGGGSAVPDPFAGPGLIRRPVATPAAVSPAGDVFPF